MLRSAGSWPITYAVKPGVWPGPAVIGAPEVLRSVGDDPADEDGVKCGVDVVIFGKDVRLYSTIRTDSL